MGRRHSPDLTDSTVNWEEDSEERELGGEGIWGSEPSCGATGVRMAKMVNEGVMVERQAGVRASHWFVTGSFWGGQCPCKQNTELRNNPPVGYMESFPTSVLMTVSCIGSGPSNYWVSLASELLGGAWSLYLHLIMVFVVSPQAFWVVALDFGHFPLSFPGTLIYSDLIHW